MSEFTNYEEMFAQSIGLNDPWKIERAEYDELKHEVHIYVSCRKTAKYPCPKCGKMCSRYDDEEKERVWRHGDVVFFPCYVHCRRPRVKCADGIHVVTAPWAREGSRYTLLFESYAMLLMKSMPVENARKLMRISHTSMTGILKYWVRKAVHEDDLSEVRAICVDETSFKRGQSYVTIVSDAQARRVIDVEEGRDAQTIVNFSYKLEDKGGDCNKIKQYVSDMSAAYISARAECFPNTKTPYDQASCIHHFLERNADETPDKTALRFMQQSMSYAELNRKASALAHFILQTTKGKNAVVAIMLERSFEMLIAIYAVLKAGCAASHGGYLLLHCQ